MVSKKTSDSHKSHAEYPDPEESARLWAMDLEDVLHRRLNYWLATEGLLLTVFAAILPEAQEATVWSVLYVFSWIGFGFTFFWYATLMRARAWHHWYFTRAQTIHKMRFGEPLGKYEIDKLGIYPPEKYFSFWNGQGLSLGFGSIALAVSFSIGWLVLGIVAARESWGLAGLEFCRVGRRVCHLDCSVSCRTDLLPHGAVQCR